MRGTEPLVAKRDPERPASLLNPIEPPCTDPYARWCDRESPRGPTYVDLGMSADDGAIGPRVYHHWRSSWGRGCPHPLLFSLLGGGRPARPL